MIHREVYKVIKIVVFQRLSEDRSIWPVRADRPRSIGSAELEDPFLGDRLSHLGSWGAVFQKSSGRLQLSCMKWPPVRSGRADPRSRELTASPYLLKRAPLPTSSRSSSAKTHSFRDDSLAMEALFRILCPDTPETSDRDPDRPVCTCTWRRDIEAASSWLFRWSTAAGWRKSAWAPESTWAWRTGSWWFYLVFLDVRWYLNCCDARSIRLSDLGPRCVRIPTHMRIILTGSRLKSGEKGPTLLDSSYCRSWALLRLLRNVCLYLLARDVSVLLVLNTQAALSVFVTIEARSPRQR